MEDFDDAPDAACEPGCFATRDFPGLMFQVFFHWGLDDSERPTVRWRRPRSASPSANLNEAVFRPNRMIARHRFSVVGSTLRKPFMLARTRKRDR